MAGLENLRILIAEDHALVRQGIAALIALEAGEVVEAEDGERALHLLKTEAFDIALIDIGLPGLTGLDVMAEIRSRQIPVKIIILTGDTDNHSPTAIYAAGADAFLYKTADADGFVDVLIAVSKGNPAKIKDELEGMNAGAIAALRETLTPRQLQIVKLVVEGASTKTAAESLFISEHTVRKHREHINAKLKINAPAALAAFAIKAGLV